MPRRQMGVRIAELDSLNPTTRLLSRPQPIKLPLRHRRANPTDKQHRLLLVRQSYEFGTRILTDFDGSGTERHEGILGLFNRGEPASPRGALADD
jgi:hypothetical protein